MRVATFLSYSAGVQSHAILEMILRGEIPRPENFAVLNADPGMEDSRSYAFVEQARARCVREGIPFITVRAPGRNLYERLLSIPSERPKRLDHPPYFTKDGNGKRGQLKQKCTGTFKIEPMKRGIRRYLQERHGIPLTRKRFPLKVVSWIGFAADETHRIKPNKRQPKYIELQYPLIERGLDRPKVEGFYLRTGTPKPPRSVCLACFANGLAHYEDMHDNRPEEWDRAVLVDDSIRDLTSIGVKNPAFVSDTLVPLRDLPGLNFLSGTKEGKEHRCNKGVCYL